MPEVLVSCNAKALSSPLLAEALELLSSRFEKVSLTGKDFRLDRPYDAWVALGGDGTLNRVVNQLMAVKREERPPVCYLPSGTGNDFARTLGLTESAEHLKRALSEPGRFFSVSVGQCNEDYFVNMASGGLFATVTPETSKPLKSVLGRFSYFLTGVGKLLEREPFGLRLNGGAEEKVLGFFVANARYAGGGMQIAPGADPFSGDLDFLVVPDLPATELVALGLSLQGEKPDLASLPVRFGSAKELRLEFSRETPINLDGEQVKVKAASFRAHSGAFRIFVPEQSEGAGE